MDENLLKELSPLLSPTLQVLQLVEKPVRKLTRPSSRDTSPLRVVPVQPVRSAPVDSPLNLCVSTPVDPPATDYFHLDDVLSLDTPDDTTAMLGGEENSSPSPVKKECNCTKSEALLEKQLGSINNSISN